MLQSVDLAIIVQRCRTIRGRGHMMAGRPRIRSIGWLLRRSCSNMESSERNYDVPSACRRRSQMLCAFFTRHIRGCDHTMRTVAIGGIYLPEHMLSFFRVVGDDRFSTDCCPSAISSARPCSVIYPCNVLFQEPLLTEITHSGWHRAVKFGREQSFLYGFPCS